MKTTFYYNLNHFKWFKTEPDGDGTAAFYNATGVFDTNKSKNYLVVCVQNVACEYILTYLNYSPVHVIFHVKIRKK